MIRKIICKKCKQSIADDTHAVEQCPFCGADELEVILTLSDKIEFHENVRGKANKIPGKSKSFSEFQAGEELSVSRGYWVEKTRRIDRENNLYHEKVVDPKTGEVIHECNEPLTKHFGHGSDKQRKQDK